MYGSTFPTQAKLKRKYRGYDFVTIQVTQASLKIHPVTDLPTTPITFSWSGFKAGEYIYIDVLSGPPEFHDYPVALWRVPLDMVAPSGSLTTTRPWCEGTYVARARQGSLLSNEVTFNVGTPTKFPTKYVALGMGLSLATILGIVLVRKKE